MKKNKPGRGYGGSGAARRACGLQTRTRGFLLRRGRRAVPGNPRGAFIHFRCENVLPAACFAGPVALFPRLFSAGKAHHTVFARKVAAAGIVVHAAFHVTHIDHVAHGPAPLARGENTGRRKQQKNGDTKSKQAQMAKAHGRSPGSTGFRNRKLQKSKLVQGIQHLPV